MSAILRSFVLAMTCLVAMSDSHDGAKLAKMKELPTDDVLLGKGTIRADGRKMLPAYLFEVKKPEESKASVRW